MQLETRDQEREQKTNANANNTAATTNSQLTLSIIRRCPINFAQREPMSDRHT